MDVSVWLIDDHSSSFQPPDGIAMERNICKDVGRDCIRCCWCYLLCIHIYDYGTKGFKTNYREHVQLCAAHSCLCSKHYRGPCSFWMAAGRRDTSCLCRSLLSNRQQGDSCGKINLP